MSDLNNTKQMIERYVATDQAQEALLVELLGLSNALTTDEKQQCIEMVNKLGGPCNHYFDLTDAIQGD
ncbi:MAG: hypothetical protein ISR70_03245 [Candidatus Thioglobus sp.]|nr:hypothetical protein [Candidatus Thioglobus pontius]MBL6977059.1 hypothetical protein [Candidatus Thioglobus sp.]MBL6984888.1 hypothetical protein [Candidatus Thioglobus sp.]